VLPAWTIDRGSPLRIQREGSSFRIQALTKEKEMKREETRDGTTMAQLDNLAHDTRAVVCCNGSLQSLL
jgi:hypothetical protein